MKQLISIYVYTIVNNFINNQIFKKMQITNPNPISVIEILPKENERIVFYQINGQAHIGWRKNEGHYMSEVTQNIVKKEDVTHWLCYVPINPCF